MNTSTTRAPFQVLVFLFRREGTLIRYAVFRRSDGPVWQAVSGGGEGEETPLQAAQRETREETGLMFHAGWIPLKSQAMIPVKNIAGYLWGPDVHTIPEHCFAVEVTQPTEIRLSDEHTDQRWCSFPEALDLLTFESNWAAIRELDGMLKKTFKN